METKTCEVCGKQFDRTPDTGRRYWERRKCCSRACKANRERNTIEKLLQKTEIDPETGCRLWLGNRVEGGYGLVKFNGHFIYIHRLMWENVNGPIPEGRYIDHICRVRSCCNPEHMRLVTTRENIMAPGSLALAARHAKRTCCPKCGGELTPHPRRSGRICLPCTRKRSRDAYQRKKASTGDMK